MEHGAYTAWQEEAAGEGAGETQARTQEAAHTH